MIIFETHIFTKRVTVLLSDEEYRRLQNELILNPDRGKIIRSSGGLRKVRWSLTGKGKSGGARIIYYWAKSNTKILMLFIFAKNEQDDLSDEQIKILKSIVEKEYK